MLTTLRILALAFLVSASAVAQTNTKITGLVTDEKTFYPIAGAVVAVEGTGYLTTTGNQGEFRFDNVPSGEYRLMISSLGYAPLTYGSVLVYADATTQVNIKLKPSPLPQPEVAVYTDAFTPLSTADAIILTQKEIEKHSASSLAELLSSLPGVYVQQAGPGGGVRVSLRGSASDQVLILLNGAKINSAQTGEADLGAIPVSQISEVRVVKGAQTARFGADAMAGVVEILTRRPGLDQPGRAQLKSGTGSSSWKTLEYGAERKLLSGFGVSLSGTKSSSNGEFTYSDRGKILTRTNAGFDAENLYSGLFWTSGKTTEASVSFSKYFARRGLPGPLLQSNDSAYTKDNRLNLTFNSSTRLNSSFTLATQAGFQDWRQTFHIQEQYYIPANVDYYNRQADINTRLEWRNKNTQTAWGASYLLSSLEGKDFQRPNLSIGKVSRTNWAAFTNLVREFQPFFANLGVVSAALRYDHTPNSYSQLSPQAGILLSWGQNTTLRAKANWGKAYHHPSLNALFWKDDAFSAGNPNLKPERAESFDYGVEAAIPVWGRLEAGVTFSHSRIRDLILWQRNFEGKYIPVNISQSKSSGYEQYVCWRQSNGLLEVELSHTRMNAVNLDPLHTHYGNLLPFRPRHLYAFKLFVNSEKLDVNLRARYASKRYTREQNTEGKILPAYSIWDLGFKFKQRIASVKLNWGISVLNFTDQDYQLIERYPMPGREFRLVTGMEL